jgi:type I restriction enzyme R subunit
MINETQIEQYMLDIFCELGWEVCSGADITNKDASRAAISARAERDFGDTILRGRLEQKIRELNPWLPAEKLDEIVRKITRTSDSNDVTDNRDFHRLLTEGADTEYRENGEVKTRKVFFADFANSGNNDFLAVSQLTVVQDGAGKRPDIVLFVNGLPLGVIELKNAADPNADLAAAYNQIQTYRRKISGLFRFNELCVISDGLDAKIGTFSAPENRFAAWKTVNGEEIQRSVQIDTLTRGVFEKSRVLDIVKNFIVFEKGDAGYIKKLAAYHQYWAVNKALATTASAVSGDHRAGVVWHTQGSGKSLSMVFYAGKLISASELHNPTLVVVTDRNDLDGQLYGTFHNCADLLRQTPVQAGSRAGLKKLLDREAGGVIFTTIQKFEDGRGAISRRSNIIVVADEAHRSQYGLKARADKDGRVTYGAAKYMRDTLPNASYIGFTGTPIELDDRSTRAVFGDYIDIYDVARAVEDGATVPIFYESRLVDLGLDDETKKWMDAEVDALFENAEMSKSEQLKAEFARKEAIVGNIERVRLIAGDIVEHFEKREEVFRGKGMVVAMSRRIAASLYDEIVALRPEWHSDGAASGAIKCVITGASSDPANLQKHIRVKPDRAIVEKRFKDAKSDLKLVIVCDMWLTGFDVPPLHTMYLDKPLKMHNLMQAIARVNRVYPDKDGGLVVDYLGVAGALRDAMAVYAESGGKGTPAADIEAATAEMNRRAEVVRDLFHGFDYSAFFSGSAGQKLEVMLDAEEFILSKTEDGEARLKREVHGLYKAFSLAMPQPDALAIREEVAFFQAVKARLTKSGETGKLDGDYKIQLQQIVDKAIKPLGIVDVFEAAGLEKRELPMLSEEFLAEIKNYKRKSLAVRALEKLLADQIRAGFARNAIKSEQFSELIKRALDRYRNGTVEAAQIIEELIDIARKLKADIDSRPPDMTADEIAFYDALADNGSAREVLGDEQLREIARYLVEKVRKNITTDWSVRESARAQLKYEVRKALNKFGYPPDKQKLAAERVLLQAEALGSLIIDSQSKQY